MQNNDDKIVHLLKHGRSEDVKSYVRAQEKEKYPEDFSMFMEQMLSEYHVKRKEVALRSGLSQDYTYKLLRGTKKTNERDYILAMCIAVGMNLAQIQHALNIYGMPMLNRADSRSNVIYAAIENRLNIDDLNGWLEKAGFVYLKTSPDMPSAEIVLRTDTATSFNEKDLATTVPSLHVYEEIDRQIEAEHCGNAPMDYIYFGIITVQDELGNKYSVQAAYGMEGDNYIVLDEENFEKSLMLEEAADLDINVMEQYDTLADAGKSEFFKFFLELDKATDEKVIETMSQIDDTRNYGMRIGAKFEGSHKICYLEAFNTKNPAEREYLQVVQKDGTCSYTASRESYFMRLELGDLYPIYFGEKREPEYYVNVSTPAEIGGKDLRLKFLFDDLRLQMHLYAKETFGGLFDEPDFVINQEMISSIIQKATWLMHNNQLEESLELLQQAVELMEEAEESGADYSISLIITYSKIAITLGNIDNVPAMFNVYDIIYQMKDRIPDILNSQSEGIEGALHAVAESMVYKAQLCQNMRGQYDEEAKTVIKEAIDLLEGKCTYAGSWTTLFMAYTKYAYMIDVDNPEDAAMYCRKAIAIVNKFHLDHDKQQQDLVVTLYNNYAWVLWNKLGSEEAIIYYGRAIELLESFLFESDNNQEEVRARLKHEGEALYNLYVATCKDNEAQRLKKRLLESNVEI